MVNKKTIMNLNIILILILLVGCQLSSMDKIEAEKTVSLNFNEVENNDSIHIAIVPLRTYFYKGIDNLVEIQPFENNYDSIELKIEGCNGSVKKSHDNVYIVNLNEFGNFYLKLIIYKEKKKIQILSTKYQSKTLPIQNVSIANKEFGEIDKNILISAKRINASIFNMDIDINYTITEFTVSTFNENGENIENISTSAYFTEKQIEQIKNLKSGQKVYFENIKGKTYDGINRNLGTLTFMIK